MQKIESDLHMSSVERMRLLQSLGSTTARAKYDPPAATYCLQDGGIRLFHTWQVSSAEIYIALRAIDSSVDPESAIPLTDLYTRAGLLCARMMLADMDQADGRELVMRLIRADSRTFSPLVVDLAAGPSHLAGYRASETVEQAQQSMTLYILELSARHLPVFRVAEAVGKKVTVESSCRLAQELLRVYRPRDVLGATALRIYENETPEGKLRQALEQAYSFALHRPEVRDWIQTVVERGILWT